tara:strand:+ start:11386 stop:11541 length:156 start_codon:yes stop_codon:yes gene_type:complete
MPLHTDWSQRDDIKAELKVGLILVLAKHGYPPVDRHDAYKDAGDICTGREF